VWPVGFAMGRLVILSVIPPAVTPISGLHRMDRSTDHAERQPEANHGDLGQQGLSDGEHTTTECSHVPLDERTRMLPHVAPLAGPTLGQTNKERPAARWRICKA
jgi:hypothetical protein